MLLHLNSRFAPSTVFFLFALLSAASHTVSSQSQTPGRGVVVEDVAPNSAGEKAGIKPGDVLLSWIRNAAPPANPQQAKGAIGSVFDWMWVDIEQGPRGTVSVTGEREGKGTTFEVAMGNWGIKVRPRFDDDALKTYLDGRAAAGSKQSAEGIALWSDVVKAAHVVGHIEVAVWMNLLIGDTWAASGRWSEAALAYQAAREETERAPSVVAQGIVWHSIGAAFLRQSKLSDAEKAFQSSLLIREKTSSESLSVAASLHNLGVVAYSRGDLATAESYYKRALEIRNKLAPGSLDMARSVNNLGNIAFSRGDLSTAESYYRRALGIHETVAPGSLDQASSMNAVGSVAYNRGDLATAEVYYKQALTIREKLAPNEVEIARVLNNLGLVARNRGDATTAEAYHRRALAVAEKVAPDSLVQAAALNSLGNLAHYRGDAEMSEAYLKRGLAIHEKLAPDSLDVAASLNNLGLVARSRGDLAAAESYQKRALTIREKHAPNSLHLARSLGNLGFLASDRGDLPMAEAYLKRALALHEKLAPDGLDLARCLNGLGIVARQYGDLKTAASYLARALAIREKLAPGSSDEAESQHDLAVVYRKSNQLHLAADHFRRGIGALEGQIGRLGGSQETRSGFRAQFADYYRDYLDLLIELKQPAEAFQTLERSRARTLLAMLAERDLVFSADVSEEIERERKRIAAEYDQTQSRLAQLNPLKEQLQIEALLNRLRELRDRQSEIVERIRQQSPRLASLQYPLPLDFKAVQAALDAGTLLLSYSVHKDKTYVFALRAHNDIRVHTLGINEIQLREQIEQFRSQIQRAQVGGTDLTALLDRGTRLYEALLQPVANELEKAQRVLVIPDGPLHVLPFSALVRRVNARAARDGREWQYLVEWKPVHVALSATVYAELRKEQQHRGASEPGKTLTAFGDPRYPEVAAREDQPELEKQNVAVRSLLARGYRLTPLPSTKSEVAAIGKLYGEKADIYVGEAATEGQAKRVAGRTRYLHFASHGLLDERLPLNSGLALTIPEKINEGEENGILQAWEIFERMRIDADLVVLSACETGLGKEMGGEGLVGLTRAFQYAGAHAVLASLWGVGDESTVELMSRFYGHLKKGKSKDEALRAAQIELIRMRRPLKDTRGTTLPVAHPFHWAAFQLFGDWR